MDTGITHIAPVTVDDRDVSGRDRCPAVDAEHAARHRQDVDEARLRVTKARVARVAAPGQALGEEIAPGLRDGFLQIVPDGAHSSSAPSLDSARSAVSAELALAPDLKMEVSALVMASACWCSKTLRPTE